MSKCNVEKQKLYAIKSPSGILLWNTAASSRKKAWYYAYEYHLYSHYSNSHNKTKAAYANGWRCVVVRLIEA